MDDFTRYVRKQNNVRRCPECGKKMTYTAVHGVYSCSNCNLSIKDIYGQMKELLEERPYLSKVQLSKILNVPLREVNQYIKDGVLENPNPDR